MLPLNPVVYHADVMGIPVFGLLDRAGGTLPDALLLALFIGAASWFVLWGRAQIKRIDAQQAKRDKDWADAQKKLQEDWEETLETMRLGLKETFAQMTKTHEAQFASIQALVLKLEEHKTWTESCNLKHAGIEEWKKNIDERLKEGVAKFAMLEQRIHEVSTKK